MASGGIDAAVDMVNTVTLAFRNLKRNKLRSFLAIIGIILGTMAITALASLGLGLQQSIESQFERSGGTLIQVTPKSTAGGPPGENAVASITEDDQDVIGRTRGVSATAGRLIEPSTVKTGEEEGDGFVATMPENAESRDIVATELNYDVAEGRFIKPGERTGVVIGASYAEDQVLGEILRVRDDISIRDTEFEVVGILERTDQFVVDQSIVMNEDVARDVYDKPSAYDVIIAQPSGDVQTVKENIMRAMRDDRGVDEGDETFDVQTNKEAISSITSVLQIISGVLAAIGAISLVLGGITIMNTMYTTVLQRTQEIGVMKSVGAKRKDITLLFVAEAGLLGGIGGIIGSTVGLGLAQVIASLARSGLGIPFFEALLSPTIFTVGVVFAAGTGLISGYAPARRAAKKNPVEALRG